MACKRSPPPIAAALLSRVLRGPRSEALLGDLAEQYYGGRSRAWYLRQALSAIAAHLHEQPPRPQWLRAFRLAMIACLIVGASLDAKWPLFLLALDPTWPLLRRAFRAHRRSRGLIA